MDAVKKALSLAEPGGYTRVFVDEGPPMAELLEKILFSSLEKIFIENRIYREIEECETWVEVLVDFKKHYSQRIINWYMNSLFKSTKCFLRTR